MRKYRFNARAIAGAVVIAFAFYGCGDDEEAGVVGPEPDEVVATVVVTPNNPPTFLSLNQTRFLSARARASDGTTIEGKVFTWASDDESVAMVSDDGLVTAMKNGTATVTATTEGVSGSAFIEVEQTAAKIAFRAIAHGAVRTDMAPVQVEIRDALGSVVPTASDPVTIELGNNPGNLVLHASGIDPGDCFIELVDPMTPVVLAPPLSTSEGDSEMLALEYDPICRNLAGCESADRVLATARDGTLYTIEETTGTVTAVGPTGLADRITGIAFHGPTRNHLFAVQQNADDLLLVDPLTGENTLLARLVIEDDSITGFNGLDENPTTGMLYGVAKLASKDGTVSDLVMIHAAYWNWGVVTTHVAELSEDGVVAITFLSDGTLLAATGDDAAHPETLWAVDLADGQMTPVLALGNGADGESIEAIPTRLTGTLEVAAVNGVATFSDLQIDGSGTGFTLTAEAADRLKATSAAFDIYQ